MLAGDKSGATSIDLAEKGTGTEIAVLDPEVVGMHRLQDLRQEGAFLGMAIFTGKDIADQAVPGLIYDEGFPGQGAAGTSRNTLRRRSLAARQFPSRILTRYPGSRRRARRGVG